MPLAPLADRVEACLFVYKSYQRHRQGICNSRHHKQTWICVPSLNTAYVRQINFCFEHKLLLRRTFLVPGRSSRVACYLAFARL